MLLHQREEEGMCFQGRAGFAGGYAGGLDVGCERKGVKNDQLIKNVLRKELAVTEMGKAIGGVSWG